MHSYRRHHQIQVRLWLCVCACVSVYWSWSVSQYQNQHRKHRPLSLSHARAHTHTHTHTHTHIYLRRLLSITTVYYHVIRLTDWTRDRPDSVKNEIERKKIEGKVLREREVKERERISNSSYSCISARIIGGGILLIPARTAHIRAYPHEYELLETSRARIWAVRAGMRSISPPIIRAGMHEYERLEILSLSLSLPTKNLYGCAFGIVCMRVCVRERVCVYTHANVHTNKPLSLSIYHFMFYVY